MTYNFITEGNGLIITGIVFDEGFISGTDVEIKNTDIFTTIGNGIALTINSEVLGNKTFGLNFSESTTLTTIREQAFYNLPLSKLTTYTDLINIIQIGNWAFSNTKLESILLYDNPISVWGTHVFSDCLLLKTINFDSSFTKIPQNMFDSCKTLQNIIIPNTIVEIGEEVFNNCSFVSLTFASGGTELQIKDGAFKQTIFPQLSLPTHTTSVNHLAFAQSQLKEITLPNFINYCSFSYAVFSQCTLLQTVVINGNIKGCIDSSNPGILTNDTISAEMFEACISLKQVNLYNNLQIIGNNVFVECKSLVSITLPQTLTTIGENSFTYCDSLKQVIIQTIQPILSSQLFSECKKLTSIIFDLNFQQLGVGTTLILPNENLKFYVFKTDQKTAIEQFQIGGMTPYFGKVIQVKPFYNKNFINVKQSYVDEYDPEYVMYTSPNSRNTFSDCTFYFQQGQSSNQFIIIKSSENGVFNNCVKMYSAITNSENKMIQKIYVEDNIYKFKLNNGNIKLITDIDSTYQLQNNFICPDIFYGNYLTLDCSNLSQCDMLDLSNLTSTNMVILENINKIKLTNLENNSQEQMVLRYLRSMILIAGVSSYKELVLFYIQKTQQKTDKTIGIFKPLKLSSMIYGLIIQDFKNKKKDILKQHQLQYKQLHLLLNLLLIRQLIYI